MPKVSDRATIRDRHKPLINKFIELGCDDTSAVVALLLDEYGDFAISEIIDRRANRNRLVAAQVSQAATTYSRPLPTPETSPKDLASFEYAPLTSVDLDEPINF